MENKNNNQGFTLVELIATIVVLSMVVGIASYSIVSLIKSSKEKNYGLLINSINGAAETFYQECRYSNNIAIDDSDCNQIETGITLSTLMKYGYLKGNNKLTDGSYSLINPNDNEKIDSCKISIISINDKVTVTAISPTGSCPTTY